MLKLKIKRAVSLLLFTSPSFFGMAQGDGIFFQTGKKWNDVLALAKAENKLVFVDVYTDWCGPCKEMDAEVFPKKPVGDAFNALFINYKLDAEKGEGPAIAKKYLVKSYPNYLFVNGDGVLIYRSTSSMSVSDFLKVAKNAQSESKQPQTILELENLYLSQSKNKEFMYNYLVRKTGMLLCTPDLLDEYISLLDEKERGELKNLQIIADNSNFSVAGLQLGISLETLQLHKEKLKELKQKRPLNMNSIIATAAEVSLKKAIRTKDENLLARVLDVTPSFEKDFGDNKFTVKQDYLFETMQYDKYFEATSKYVEQYLLKISLDTLAKADSQTWLYYQAYYAKDTTISKEDKEIYIFSYKHSQTIQLSNNLILICRNFATKATNPSDLKKAVAWSDYALKIAYSDPAYYKRQIYTYTLVNANLLYNTGYKKLAEEKLENLLAIRKEPGDIEGLQNMLGKIKANETLK